MARNEPTCFRDVELSPLVGQLDLRTQDGGLGLHDFRLIFNMGLNEQKARCRRGGWKALFKNSIYGFHNQDFHDQLTRCDEYRQEFTSTYRFTGGLAGYAYTYFTPGYTTPGYTVGQHHPGFLCGYAPYYYSIYSQVPTQFRCYFTATYNGYPYQYFQPVYDPWCHTPYPDYYRLPYFSLACPVTFPGQAFPGYGSGPFIGLYTNPYTYEVDYCGSYLYHRPNCNEAITMLGTITTENQGRRLIAGTKSKIAVLNEQTGNWKLIFDGLGGPYDSFDNCNTCSSRRFSMTTMGSYAFFTNDLDPVIYWPFDAKSTGCKLWAGDYVPDLLALNITKAKTICSWNGFLILGNVEEAGERKPYRIIISDFNSPLSFIPGAESLTREIDLPLDETIIRIEKLGGGLRVYTNKGIREGILVGGEEVISFQEIYAGSQGLKYAYSLVNTGDAHYYLGESTIQLLLEFDRSPNEVEWIHKAGGAIYKGVVSTWLSGVSSLAAFGPINKEHCDQAVGFFRSTSREVWFSWPTDSNECPNKSLVINIKYGGADIVDHGFTAGIEFLPDPKQSIAEWLVTQKICGWDTILAEMVKEGIPYSTAFSLTGGPTSIWNSTENLSLPADANSLCAKLGSKTLEDFCRDCAVRQVMVLASASDKTLKEYDPEIYYRERYITTAETLPCPFTITGVYVLDGYTSLLQSDLHDYGKRQEKLIDKLVVDYDAAEQTTPSNLNVGVAYAANANCPTWKSTMPVQMRCLTAYTAAQHATANTRPNLFGLFKTYWRGRYLGYRMFVEGTGGGSCFDGITQHVRLIAGEWK